MLDGVLRWLVQVTGLEPRLLTCTAILMVYAASVYLNAKKGVSVAPAQPVEFGELASALARVESGVETVAKYLVNLEKYLDDVRLYGSFNTPYVPPQEAGIHMRGTPRRPRPEKYPSSPPRSRPGLPEAGIHIGQDIEEDEPPFPIPTPSITPKSEQPGFFLPLPQGEPYQPPEQEPQLEPHIQPEQEEHQPQEPQPEPEPQPSPAVVKTLRIMSRKAGRIP